MAPARAPAWRIAGARAAPAPADEGAAGAADAGGERAEVEGGDASDAAVSAAAGAEGGGAAAAPPAADGGGDDDGRRSLRPRAAKRAAEERGADAGARKRQAQGEPDEVPYDEIVPGLRYTIGEQLSLAAAKGKYAEVLIPVEALVASNPSVNARRLWGTDVYTGDSDVVAVLQHTGYYRPPAEEPSSDLSSVQCLLKVEPVCPKGYAPSERFGIKSRSWGVNEGSLSISVVAARAVTSAGAYVDLEPKHLFSLPNTSPTYVPASETRAVATRASVQSATKQKLATEVAVMYNLCNEPWRKYHMHVMVDRGLSPSQWTSSRLLRETLYLESSNTRYELSASVVATSSGEGQVADANGGSNPGAPEQLYRFARCEPMLLAEMRATGVPLPATDVRVVEDGLRWEELRWAPNGVSVRGKNLHILRCSFLSNKQARPAAN